MPKKPKPLLRLRIILLIAILVMQIIQPVIRVRAEVVLNYFRATSQIDGILLEWQTSSESNSSGFYILRSTKPNQDYTRLNIYFLSDSETGEGVYYSYLDDQEIPNTTYYFKLEAIDLNGSSVSYGPVSAGFLIQTPTTTATPTSAQTLTVPVRTPTPTRAITSVISKSPTPTLTATTFTLLPQTITPSPTLVGTVSGKPTVTPTLEPLPSLEYLFPASTATSFASITPSPTIIATQPKLASSLRPSPLSPRYVILLGIILLLWAFLLVFLVLLIRILFQSALRVEESD